MKWLLFILLLLPTLCIGQSVTPQWRADANGMGYTYIGLGHQDTMWNAAKIRGYIGTYRTYTASNGITITGANFKLGGALVNNTIITGAFSFIINGSANILAYGDLGGDVAYVGASAGGAGINVSHSGINAVMQISPLGVVTISDGVNGQGALYGSVNSSNFLSNSLTHKKYVDSVASIGSGIAPDSALHPNKNLYELSNKATARINIGLNGTHTPSTGISGSNFNGTANQTWTNDLSTGISGGQAVTGGTGSGESLTLLSTSNATKGFINLGANATTSSVYDVTNKRLGIVTNAPTHTFTVGSTGNGYAAYNTADQTTNYERFTLSYQSNVFDLGSFFGGTGTIRGLRLGLNTNAGSASLSTGRFMQINTTQGVSSGVFDFINSTSAAGSTITLNTGESASSGLQNMLSLQGTVNQTSTAGYKALYISPFEQGTGSGVKMLIDAGTNSAANNGGTHTSKFNVTSAGVVTIPGLNVAGIVTNTSAGIIGTTPTLIDNQLLKTANYTIVAGDFAAGKSATLDLEVDATAANVTITLPSASTFKGYTIYVWKSDVSVNTVTINTMVGLNLLTTQYQSRTIKTNQAGTNWGNR